MRAAWSPAPGPSRPISASGWWRPRSWAGPWWRGNWRRRTLKIEVDQFTRAEAVHAARYLAYVVGHAHARQMSLADRDRWRGELERRRPPALDAPSWLWSSVVELSASHEGGYLEHCRRYALSQAA